MPDSKTAQLYRMVMPDHICPYGLKSKYLLERQGFKVEDHHLETRAETDAFMDKHGVETTPQTFIDGQRIGGYDQLRVYFGKEEPGGKDTSYRPVVTLFTMTLLMAVGAAFIAEGQWISLRTLEWFIAFSMCGLAYLKLRDVESFSSMFLNYDLLARKWVPYAYLYPYGEGLAGLLMIAGVLLPVAIPIAIFIGAVGAISVFKAVYVDQQELKCACVGGDSKVPLGFISLTENLMMLAMGLWMLVKPWVLA
ncbi:MAG: glutaredoxin family protein [Xanthomonadales bacterium]|nr:glutaredoxin family protein [Xanthomonadales bacterium]